MFLGFRHRTQSRRTNKSIRSAGVEYRKSSLDLDNGFIIGLQVQFYFESGTPLRDMSLLS